MLLLFYFYSALASETIVERLTSENLEKDEKIRDLEVAVSELEELVDTSNLVSLIG